MVSEEDENITYDYTLYEYPLRYSYTKNNQLKELELVIQTKLIRKNGELKLKGIEELERKDVSSKEKIKYRDPPPDGPDKNDEFVYYVDKDNDGYGIESQWKLLSGPIGGFTALIKGDCNDESFTVNPSINEICGNGIDDNCNGIVDEGCGELFTENEVDGENKIGVKKSLNDSDQDSFIDSEDECPNRSGTENGCPQIILLSDKTFYEVGETIEVEANFDDLPNDSFTWISDDDLLQTSNGKNLTTKFSTIGKKSIQLKIENEEQNYSSTKVISISVRLPKKILENKLMKISEYGNFAKLGANLVTSIRTEADKSKAEILSLILNEEILVINQNKVSQTIERFLLELRNPKTSELTVIDDIIINEVKYDDNTGLIKSFSYELH